MITQLYSSIIEVTFSAMGPLNQIWVLSLIQRKIQPFSFFSTYRNTIFSKCWIPLDSLLQSCMLRFPCHIKISRKIDTCWKKGIDRSFIDKLHGKKWPRHSNCENSHSFFVSVARGVIIANDKLLLLENGGYINSNIEWSRQVLFRFDQS